MKAVPRKIMPLLIVALLVAGAPFILCGCGGGGGGGGSSLSNSTSPEPLAALGAGPASDSVVVLDAMGIMNNLLIAGGRAESGGSGTAAAASSLAAGLDDALLHTRIGRLVERVAAEVQRSEVRSLGSGTGPVLCENAEGSGLTSVVWDGPNTILDPCTEMRQVRMTVTLQNCTLGGVSFDGLMEVSIPDSPCHPNRMQIVFDGTLIDEASDIAVDCTDFSMEGWNLVWDERGDEITHMDLVLNGTLAGSIHGQAESVSLYEVTAGFRLGADSTRGSYYAMTLDGFIQTTCLDGWLEVTTQEAVLMPLDFSCPFAGAYSLRGSDGVADIIFTESGVEISLNGEAGSYDSCEEVPSCLE